MLQKTSFNWVSALLFAISVFALGFFARTMTDLHNVAKNPARFGITFSTTYTASLGLDVEKTFEDLIDNLQIKFVRLPVYWSSIEPQKDVYDWNELDKIVKYAEKSNVKLTFVVGSKVPRWPECYTPSWALPLDQDTQQKEVLSMIQTVVTRYAQSSALERWQVENEPLFPFGLCEQIRMKDLHAQIKMVKSMDTHPIQLTVSGEFEPWHQAAEASDILGFSLYRKSWNQTLGYVVYPIPPEFYTLRANLIHDLGKKVIISELQAEPWFSESIASQSLEHWYQSFSATDFENNILFAETTHVDEVYLWGAEWWEYLKVHGDNRLWEKAKTVFK